LSRKKGYRKPDGAIVVARPSKWGNPFKYRTYTGMVKYRPSAPSEWTYEGRISGDGQRHDWYGPNGEIVVFMDRYATRDEIVELYRRALVEPDEGMHHAWSTLRPLPYSVDDVVRELRGKDLACWCKPNQPCHADVLLELANA